MLKRLMMKTKMRGGWKRRKEMEGWRDDRDESKGVREREGEERERNNKKKD